MGQEEGTPQRSADVEPVVQAVLLKIHVKAITGLGVLGTVCAFIVARWPQVEPVINSPFAVIVGMIGSMATGWFANHWTVSVPAIRRGSAAEDVIRGLRGTEREFFGKFGDMQAMIAALETEVKHLRDYVDRLEGVLKTRGVIPDTEN